MVRPLGPQADAGSVDEPEPDMLGLPGWDRQPLASRDPFDTPVVDHPSGRRAKEFGDLPVAVASISASEFDGVGSQPFFAVWTSWDLALGQTVLSEHTADPALGHLHR